MSYADALASSENGSTVTYEDHSGRDPAGIPKEGIGCARDFHVVRVEERCGILLKLGDRHE